MAQTFVHIGNSHGVIIPKKLFKELDIDPKQQIWIESDVENKSFIIHTSNVQKKVSTSPRLLKVLEKVNKEYGSALKKLANL